MMIDGKGSVQSVRTVEVDCDVELCGVHDTTVQGNGIGQWEEETPKSARFLWAAAGNVDAPSMVIKSDRR